MSIERVSAARLRCGHVDEHGRCGSLMWCDGGLDDAAVRVAAAERGWEAGEADRCPKHRGPVEPVESVEPEPEPEPEPDVVRAPEGSHTIPG